jgi:nucleoside-diphosphate kinase
MAEEQTLVLIKPDGLVKSLTGNIISKLSETELKIVGAKMVSVTRALAEEHYKHLSEKPFFEDLMKYIQGHYHTRRVMAMVYHGDNAIEKVRRIVGDTDPEKADPISLRGKYGRITTSGVFENAVHASDTAENAEREIKLWFKPDELTERIYPTTKLTKEVTFSYWK